MRHRATLPIGYNSAFLRSKNSERSWKRNVSTRSKAPCSTCAPARASFGGIFDYDAKAARLTEVNKELEDPNVWNDSKNAQALGREKKLLEGVVTTLTALDSDLRDALDLFELAREEGDEDTLVASEEDAAKLASRVGDIEFRRMFSNPADPNNCFIDIQAGAGGTEACDWASMLLRQYLRYCERKGFKAEVLEESDGDVAGIKNATVKVSGEYAYGFLRTETGIHRLVRKSPFDSSGGRHTSFSSVFVYPEIDDSIEVEINPADLRIDTYRASGAGGQHINKTDSAVRITHMPTGIVVQCQNDRSQHRNRAEAMAMLKSRLYEVEMRKRQAEQDKLESSKTDVGWGHQIRSYVLDQSRVKDLRTNVEMSNTRAVLDGDLDDFISASLKQGV
ncbi:peptide chain release factor 2 [Burkholderia lata]|uniref:Peptide chain release factor 2 n=2 Tax=Burkholderia lata (strain ATCC 17760 / DSM 23089 / LMG 22485 / NCIMB 9086 / R18194 / 383) TaxID=482957 RepID=A0A6P2Z1P3_BURL3|nr:bacterial peptide chain release factor 2 (bRF-2) [Burkholderia lata]VWB95285.1 peptide chain release factor 2 [Burkholderia lata]VWB96819.1 peptide chain release factor 2 [Burkholderia lata]VWD28533.1 peptide chain release factor 2 [Burkholderia lata]VWM15868.1 peptide chain release factor 2 [Burkholderia lata]